MFTTSATPTKPAQSTLFQDVEPIIFLNRYIVRAVMPRSNNASDSVVAFARDLENDVEVAIKTFWRFRDGSNDNPTSMLLYEGRIYHELANEPSGPVVPNIAQIIGSYHTAPSFIDAAAYPASFTRFTDYYENTAVVQEYINTLRTRTKGKPISDVYMIVTKRYPQTLQALMHTKPNAAVLKSIIFQVLYTLAAMEHYGFQHNDLHLNNIFVEPVTAPLSVVYRINQDTFKVPVPYFARLYDWNYATRGPGSNAALERANLCPRYGICNRINSRYDLYTLAGYMFNFFIPTEVKYFLFDCVPNKETERMANRMCRVADGTAEGVCMPYDEGTPSTVLSAGAALRHKWFRSFRV